MELGEAIQSARNMSGSRSEEPSMAMIMSAWLVWQVDCSRKTTLGSTGHEGPGRIVSDQRENMHVREPQVELGRLSIGTRVRGIRHWAIDNVGSQQSHGQGGPRRESRDDSYCKRCSLLRRV